MAKKKKKKKKVAAESKPAGKDAFGSRIGSARAGVNKALTEKPQTLPEIKTKAGLKTTNTFSDHLASLVEAKLIKNTGGKYALTSKGQTAMAKGRR